MGLRGTTPENSGRFKHHESGFNSRFLVDAGSPVSVVWFRPVVPSRGVLALGIPTDDMPSTECEQLLSATPTVRPPRGQTLNQDTLRKTPGHSSLKVLEGSSVQTSSTGIRVATPASSIIPKLIVMNV